MGTPHGVEITGPMKDRYDEILTTEALEFLADLHRRFEPRRQELLAARKRRQEEISAGANLDFLPETKASAKIRTGASPRLPRGWSTAVSRSLAPPTAR